MGWSANSESAPRAPSRTPFEPGGPTWTAVRARVLHAGGATGHNQSVSIAREVNELVEQRYAALVEAARDAGVSFYDDAGVGERIERVLLASDFAFDAMRREPALLGPGLIEFVNDPRRALPRALVPADTRDDDAAFAAWLRRFPQRA